jgi:hypothetical protein
MVDWLTKKLNSKDLAHGTREVIEQLQTPPLSAKKWASVAETCKNEDANPLPLLVRDIADLINGLGYPVPASPEDKTPAELRLGDVIKKVPRDAINFPNVPDESTIAELVKVLPEILLIANDTQTNLWDAYRQAKAAQQCTDGGDFQEAMRCAVNMASSLVRGATGAIADTRSQKARQSADALHDAQGGSRNKQKAIRALWASGKFTSRDRCAEEECAQLGMSFAAARRALRNTPDPT